MTCCPIYFGEHARELISSEVALEFSKHLCGHVSNTKAGIATLLSKVKVVIVPVVNIPGRAKLETDGDYCHRTNEDGVDLNRNWDAHWKKTPRDDTFSGSAPFSEPQTKYLHLQAMKSKPKVFITVHSGAESMFTPYAYEQSKPTSTSETVMLNILQDSKASYCPRCNVGTAASILGYASYGTSLDYMYDKVKTPYVYGLEIYLGDDSGKSTSNYRKTMLRTRKRVSKNFPRPSTDTSENCFYRYNPPSAEAYKRTVEKWSANLIDLLTKTLQADEQA